MKINVYYENHNPLLPGGISFTSKNLPDYKMSLYEQYAPILDILEVNGIDVNIIGPDTSLEEIDKYIFPLIIAYFYEEIVIDNIFKHISDQIKNDINNGKCLLVFNNSQEGWFYDELFYAIIVRNLRKNNINCENVLIVSNVLLEDFYPTNVVVWHQFETATRLRMKTVDDDFNTIDLGTHPQSKKFICLNSFLRPHRIRFLYEMWQRDLLNSMRISFRTSSKIFNPDNILLTSIPDKDQLQTLLNNPDFTYDPFLLGNMMTRHNDVNLWGTKKLQNENLIFIITETLFNGLSPPHLTEKTFKAIRFKMPFIIVGQSRTLQSLKDLGYKTFENLWDESYDAETDPLKRMEMICKLIEDLNNLSFEELRSMILANADILEHNYNTLMTNKAETNLIKYITDAGFILPD
jgi:hypothetical protein